ncbi:MAG TPA: hypothetical protein VGN82_26400 [Bosea sp. (in: a-proteobacteria)]|uniref:hypothetical protein n=1 Tax=Bosea sp. (in: a-proteobacteria) TaxID=1871050 RepID=UPI002E12EC12|nr:hypothetical protein [Bosea sp. (in: a-proteobacteria)]
MTSSPTWKRERLRSRFHVASLLAGLALLVTGCASQFGLGMAELPASQGWEPLPIGTWVLNDGLEARTMVFCPRDACIRQGFASVIAFSGSEAAKIDQALKADPASLARLFSKPPEDDQRSRPKSGSKRPAKSTTTVSRFEAEGVPGILVEIRAKGSSGKSATTAILRGREGDRLVVALAVAEDAEAARRDAVAAWRSR